MTHEAQSLHLRYGLVIALSTLNPCRYLHEPKTRFPVGRLFPLPGRELHPLKAPGLSWRTEDSPKVRVDDDPPTITTTVKEQGLIGDQWISWVTAALYDR